MSEPKSAFDHAFERIERLERENQALLADALRYRWLRDGWWLDPKAEDTPDPMAFAQTPEQFDAAIDEAIDAAMKGT